MEKFWKKKIVWGPREFFLWGYWFLRPFDHPRHFNSGVLPPPPSLGYLSWSPNTVTSISIFLFLRIGVVRTSHTLRIENITPLQPNIASSNESNFCPTYYYNTSLLSLLLCRLYKPGVRKSPKKRKNVEEWQKMLNMTWTRLYRPLLKPLKLWNHWTRKTWQRSSRTLSRQLWLKKSWRLSWYSEEQSQPGPRPRDSWVSAYITIPWYTLIFNFYLTTTIFRVEPGPFLFFWAVSAWKCSYGCS